MTISNGVCYGFVEKLFQVLLIVAGVMRDGPWYGLAEGIWFNKLWVVGGVLNKLFEAMCDGSWYDDLFWFSNNGRTGRDGAVWM